MMSEMISIRVVVAIGIGFTAGAGIVGFYADRAVRALRAHIRYLQRLSDCQIRSKGRI